MKNLLTSLVLLLAAPYLHAQSWQWARQNTGGYITEGIFGYPHLQIATDAFGNVYAFGDYDCPSISFGAFSITNPGGVNIFLVKYDSSGNVVWLKSISSISSVMLN